jgi:hypothetical protein
MSAYIVVLLHQLPTADGSRIRGDLVLLIESTA